MNVIQVMFRAWLGLGTAATWIALGKYNSDTTVYKIHAGPPSTPR